MVGNLQPLQIKAFMITCEITGNSLHVSDNPVLQSFSGDSDHHCICAGICDEEDQSFPALTWSSTERIVYPKNLDLSRSVSAVLRETEEMLKSLLTSALVGSLSCSRTAGLLHSYFVSQILSLQHSLHLTFAPGRQTEK